MRVADLASPTKMRPLEDVCVAKQAERISLGQAVEIYEPIAVVLLRERQDFCEPEKQVFCSEQGQIIIRTTYRGNAIT